MTIRVCDRCKKPMDIGYTVRVSMTSNNGCVMAANVHINGMFRPLRDTYDLCDECLKHIIQEVSAHEPGRQD